jgi:hypothetical protein
MEISRERLGELKRIFKEDYGKELTDKEAYEAGYNILHFSELLIDMAQEHYRWDEKVEEDPKGFAMEGRGRSCCICGQSVYDGDIWYDKYGLKCLHCQKAVEKNQIPKSVCKNRDSFYLGWDLKSKFGLHPQTLAKMVREGKVKERIIKTKDNKGIHCRLFLKKENNFN